MYTVVRFIAEVGSRRCESDPRDSGEAMGGLMPADDIIAPATPCEAMLVATRWPS